MSVSPCRETTAPEDRDAGFLNYLSDFATGPFVMSRKTIDVLNLASFD